MIGHTRRDLIQSRILRTLNLNPSANNQELAVVGGVSRNTVTKYLRDIREKEEREANINHALILANLEEQGQAIRRELMCLWTDAYHELYATKPAQLVQISLAKWQLEKDLAHLRLTLSQKVVSEASTGNL